MTALHPLSGAFLLAVALGAQAQGSYVNVTAGGPLRPGVYGRIEIRNAPPPPLISPQPMVATKTLGPVTGEPLYLYLPPGQVRKWALHCQRHQACERPVYFIRLDNNPGKLGRWKASREKERDASHLAFADRRF